MSSSTWWYTIPSPGIFNFPYLSLFITFLSLFITFLSLFITFLSLFITFHFRKISDIPGEGVEDQKVESDITKRSQMFRIVQFVENMMFSRNRFFGQILEKCLFFWGIMREKLEKLVRSLQNHTTMFVRGPSSGRWPSSVVKLHIGQTTYSHWY